MKKKITPRRLLCYVIRTELHGRIVVRGVLRSTRHTRLGEANLIKIEYRPRLGNPPL